MGDSRYKVDLAREELAKRVSFSPETNLEDVTPAEVLGLRKKGTGRGRAVALALILFFCGLVSASVGGVYWLGKSEKPAAPFFILGALTLIPGGYYSYISWQAYRGVDGFSFSQLPEF